MAPPNRSRDPYRSCMKWRPVKARAPRATAIAARPELISLAA
jgi:hypothetical protein